jgi:hypothetical protein
MEEMKKKEGIRKGIKKEKKEERKRKPGGFQ